MSFKSFIKKIIFDLKKNSSRICLLLIAVIGINGIMTPLMALSPTKRIHSEDFTCVRKGFLPERKICEKEEIIDDFLDSEGPFGITGKGQVKKKGIEEEVDEIFTQTMDEEEALKVDTLLRELQKEADVFLAEDFRKGQRISLEEAIYLALRDNEGVGFDTSTALASNISTGITSAFLDREAAKQSLLATLEQTWTPTWNTTIATNFSRAYIRNGPYTTTVSLPSPGISATQLLKTGGKIAFSWENTYSYTQISGRPRDTTASTTLSLQLTQPLLKGGGFEVGTIPLVNAYLGDEASINQLIQIVIDNVTLTITTYRGYLQAIDEFEIDKRAIYKGRDDLAQTKALVEAGRRPRADIVERQRYLAQQEFNFQDQRNTVDQKRIEFLRQINMDTSTNLVPEDLTIIEMEPEDLPKIEELMTIAFLHNANYLNQLISLRQAELTYIQARNNTLWDLSLTAGISSTGSKNFAGLSLSSLGRSNEKAWDFRDRTVNVGLALTIPFNQVEERKSALLNAKIALRNSKIALRKREQDLTKDIKNSLRSMKKDIIQIKLAKINTELSKKRVFQKRLEIEGGLSSSFELTGVQDDLISAEKAEVDAKITYMNDIAALDALLGTTLDSWNVNITRRLDNMPRLNDIIFGKVKTHSSENNF